MGLFDIFKGKQYKEELEELQKEYNSLKEQITPEMLDAQAIQKEISRLNEQKGEQLKQIEHLDNMINEKNSVIDSLCNTIKEKIQEIVRMDDEILVQEFGLYQPQYGFASSLDYKEALASVRMVQKNLIKDKRAVTGATDWTVNGNASKGKKMVSDTQKLLLRAFNSECDEVIGKVKYTNFDASLNKITKSAEAISKLGTIMKISITNEYLSAKTKELRLAFEYQLKKQKEKEELKAAREEQREQAKIQKELDEQRKIAEKEQAHYKNYYSTLLKQIEKDPNNEDLLSKRNELENQLSKIEASITDIDYRQANMKAGYVYIISNIGAFGENVYKIGMTRRLDPQDRVDELGDASVSV